jgi:hypothetical protein
MSSNKWITHVKKWSSDHKIAYGCAISDPECKKAYHSVKTVKTVKPIVKPVKPNKQVKEEVCSIIDQKEVRKSLFARLTELSKLIDESEDVKKAGEYRKEKLKIMELIKKTKKA